MHARYKTKGLDLIIILGCDREDLYLQNYKVWLLICSDGDVEEISPLHMVNEVRFPGEKNI
jgi:hypothetical protein